MQASLRCVNGELAASGCLATGATCLGDGPGADIQAFGGSGDTEWLDVELDRPLGDEGTLSVWFRTPRAYLNGNQAEECMEPMVELPGFGHYELGLPWDIVSAILDWQWQEPARPADACGKMTVIPGIPGPKWFHFAMSWRRADGRLTFYWNGTPTSVPDLDGGPWAATSVSRLRLCVGRFQFADLQVDDSYRPAAAVTASVPEFARGQDKEMFGVKDTPPVDVDARRGDLLYQCSMASPEEVADWVLDAGVLTFADGWMQMESAFPDSDDPNLGHQVIWCPRTFPSSFVAEWDIHVRRNHLIIVFLAAHGTEGRDLFDPSMPERHGEFIHYIKEAIKSYHISYHASGRGISNLRKNNKFYLCSTGPTGIPAGSRDVHRIRLVKDEAHVQLQVDGRVVIDFVDADPARYDEPYGAGKIGLRHMRDAVAGYRDFRVWALR